MVSSLDTAIPMAMPTSSSHSPSTDALWCGPVRSAIGSPAYGATGGGW